MDQGKRDIFASRPMAPFPGYTIVSSTKFEMHCNITITLNISPQVKFVLSLERFLGKRANTAFNLVLRLRVKYCSIPITSWMLKATNLNYDWCLLSALDKPRHGNLRLLPTGCNNRNCLQNGSDCHCFLSPF